MRNELLRNAVAGLLALTLSAGAAQAGDVKYRPINPNFGGNPFNGDYLLNQARLQNQHEEDAEDPLERFDRDLTRRLLNRAASEIEDRLFGENPEDSGTIPLGDLKIEFERIGATIFLKVVDLVTGGVTEIEIPAPGS
ncbi:curli assembly protein CsgF [Qipengyuania sp. GH1]|uniref:curli assembly protein CsgF n=1 Tax=Qipengyuania aestuarii TaxID=2867241 RepID=UPI001C8738BD|nr:curli assembly protein CsgF [Qipengyuania aestuarii]MBX7535005.1 curli assembly protein CsgF [Qipengyuania aestuarii]